MRDPARRHVIVAGGTLGIGALAGCINPEDGEGPEPDEENGAPADDTGVDIDHENPAGSVEFVEPEDCDTVESPFTVELETTDFDVTGGEEGELADDTGHHHILIDRDPVEPGDVIPDGPGYLHLNHGETETELDLSAGEYDLIAQPGDGSHTAFDMTDEISITVENGDGEHDPDDDAPFPQDDADDDADENGNDETDADENGDDETDDD